MNTADRSIALMDVALRRRFTFEELMPDAGVIRSRLQARVPDKPFIDLVVGVFEALNDRIRFLDDRDHQLGHSYFLEVTDVASLRQVFLDRIVPMLQEYFYGAWDKICVVLGLRPYNEVGEPKRRDAVVRGRSRVAEFQLGCCSGGDRMTAIAYELALDHHAQVVRHARRARPGVENQLRRSRAFCR